MPKSISIRLTIVLFWINTPIFAESSWSHSWSQYGGSEKGLQHSSLDQINLSNIGGLKEAWRYRTGELSQNAKDGYFFQTNPILVRNKLYLTTGSSIIIALDPTSGHEIWRYDPKLDRSKSTSETANRGASSWIDPQRKEGDLCYHRIMTGTLDSRLLSVDGDTGKPCLDFGLRYSGHRWSHHHRR